MPTVQLASILNELHTDSVLAMFASTGVSDTSVFRQAQRAAINLFYERNGGFRGVFGFPLDNDAQFADDVATRDYAGGKIKFLTNTPQGEDVTAVNIRFLGFHCNSESKWDQGTGSDEPYFMIGAAAANGSKTVRFGPYEDIDSGTVRFEAAEIAGAGLKADNFTPPIALGIVAMEHDDGNPQEAEDGVRKAIEDIESKFDEAVGAFSGASTTTHVLPQWARDILIGWVPEGIAAIFGLADDDIGKNVDVLFDNKADLAEWTDPPVLGKFGDNEYNKVINIDGGDQGNYDLYFLVNLVHIIVTVK